MSGNIPDSGDLYDMFKDPDGPDKTDLLDKNPEDSTVDVPIDDATTNYTKDDYPKHKPLISLSKEPIFGISTLSNPKVVDADDDPPTKQPDLDKIPEDAPIEAIGDLKILPNIYATE